MRGLFFLLMAGALAAGAVPALGGIWFPPSGGGLTADPLPPRQPVPFAETVPYDGFAVWPATRTPILPLDGVAHPARWAALRRTLAHADSARTPVLAGGSAPPREMEPTAPPADLGRESEAFRVSWQRALDAAQAGRAHEVRRILGQAPPAGLTGERLARRLLFAAVVMDNDLGAADSLFYRMAWNDRGRTAARLGAWERLLQERGEDARRELNTLGDLGPGEQVVSEFAAWMSDEPALGGTLPEVQDAPLLKAATELLRARRALAAGAPEEARQALGRVSGRLPAAWEPTARRLEEAAQDPTGREDPGGAAGSLSAAVDAYVRGDDAAALGRIDEWLALWPGSPERAAAYRMRAELHLAAGNLDAAEFDLRAAERLGGDAVRRDLALAFLRARQQRGSEARTVMQRVVAGPWGAAHEAEALFHQARLARLLGDASAAEVHRQTLEEAFPGEAWTARALADQDAGPGVWGAPFRTAPGPAPVQVHVPAPRRGPWGPLLWGEHFLSREATALRAAEAGPIEGVAQPTPVVEHGAPTAPTRNLVFAHAGLGAPAAILFGGGLSGGTGDLLYRASLGRSFAQQRNELPDFRRLDWEASLAADPDRVHLGLTAEGTSRTDDDAPVIGLSPRQVQASWWGVRGDAGYRASEVNHVHASLSHGQGQIENGSDRWNTEQTWFSLDADLDSLSGGWAARVTLGALDYRQPVIPKFRFWFRDFRVVKRYRERGYLGVRASLYSKRALVMPVAGVETLLGGGWTAWAATEPTLLLPTFRDVFVTGGDWNLPDFTLPAERRYLDARGGLRWRDRAERRRASAEVNVYKTGELRTWRRTGALWTERSLEDATGLRIKGEGALQNGDFTAAMALEAQSVRAEGEQVPYVPTYVGRLQLGYRVDDWRFGIKTLAVSGREDENGSGYGAFARWDLEAAYRYLAANLPLGFQSMEFTLRIENLTDVEDRRWPTVPAYGLGIYGGVQAVYGN